MSALNDVIASLLAERYAGEWWPTERAEPQAPDELAGARRRRELAAEVDIAERQIARRRRSILREG